MIVGIIIFILFIFAMLRMTKNRVLKKAHIPVSIALIALIIAHNALTIGLLKTRPFLATLAGIIGVLFIIITVLSGFAKKIKIHRISAFISALFIVLHIVLNIAGFADYQSKVRSINFANIDVSEVPDGVYFGECDVTYIYAKVQVTVKFGKITDIEILEHRNERGKPAERVVTDIIERQEIGVDAVTGATNSSSVIKKAVENALQMS